MTKSLQIISNHFQFKPLTTYAEKKGKDDIPTKSLYLHNPFELQRANPTYFAHAVEDIEVLTSTVSDKLY